MDPLPPNNSSLPAAVPAERPAVAPTPTSSLAIPPLTPDEEVLVQALIKRGYLTADQVRSAQQYGAEHGRDLRQSILELNLISPELLNQLAFERLAAMAKDAPAEKIQPPRPPAPVTTLPLSPDRTQHHRDVRKELQELTVTAPLPDVVGQILERAFECRATDIHFDSQETGLRVRYRIDGQLQDILFVEPCHGHRHDQPAQGDVQPEHRRAQALPGRPDLRDAPQPAPRPAGGHVPDDLWREDRDPDPRGPHRRRGLRSPGDEPAAGRGARPPGRPALRRGARRRAGGGGQDLHALQLPGADQLAPQERDDHRGSRSSTGSPGSTRPRSTPRATWASARA